MNQFLKIALDHPAKAEKIFLWLLQSLIVIWIISLVFHVKIGSCFYTGDNTYIGEECLKNISAIHIATAVVVFALTYVLCWVIFADLIVQLIFRILGKIGNLLFTLVLKVLLFPIYLFLLLKAIIKKTDKPLKYWSSNAQETETEVSTNDYIKNQEELKSNLEFFYFMNRVTESSIWTEFLLNILSYEKVDFIQSRIIRYFTILVIVLGANINLLKLNELTLLKIIIIVIVILSGLLIFKFNDIYSKFSNSQILELIPKLENELYRDFVFKALTNSRLMYYYDIEKKIKTIVLQLKPSADQIDMFDNYARIIEFIPYQSNQMDITRIFKNRSPKSTEMKILISQNVPEIWEQNIINKLGVYYVYAECEEDILDAIHMLQPFVSGVQKLNKKI